MRFFTTAFVALSSLVALTFAAGNAITNPTAGTVVKSGSTFPIQWTDPVGQSVSLVLRKGKSDSLGTIETLASNIVNTGSFSWVVKQYPSGNDYAIMITWEGGENYSPQFTIEGNGAPISSSSVSSPVSSPVPSSNSTVTGSMSSSIYSTTLPPSHNTTHTTTTHTTGKPHNTTTTSGHESSSTQEPTTTKKSGGNTTTSGSGTESTTTTTKGVPDSGSAANAVSSVLALVIAGIWALAL